MKFLLLIESLKKDDPCLLYCDRNGVARLKTEGLVVVLNTQDFTNSRNVLAPIKNGLPCVNKTPPLLRGGGPKGRRGDLYCRATEFVVVKINKNALTVLDNQTIQNKTYDFPAAQDDAIFTFIEENTSKNNSLYASEIIVRR